RANQRGDTRLTTRYRHRTRPNLEDNVGGDENHRELRRNTPESEMTNTEISQDLNQKHRTHLQRQYWKFEGNSFFNRTQINRTEIDLIHAEVHNHHKPDTYLNHRRRMKRLKTESSPPSILLHRNEDQPPDSFTKRSTNRRKQSRLHNCRRDHRVPELIIFTRK
ncbi:LOW QUALITY PROTEIN: hypothetical protein HID58_054831, partial [Brassica napus]